MQETKYNIFMYTPLGKRHGILTITRTENVLSGWLNILKHNNPVEGIVDENGNCKISGSSVTLMHTVPFVAAGKISNGYICLQVQNGQNTFELSGEACPHVE